MQEQKFRGNTVIESRRTDPSSVPPGHKRKSSHARGGGTIFLSLEMVPMGYSLAFLLVDRLLMHL